jgi:hypothetical protein
MLLDDEKVSDHKTLWQRTYGSWRRGYQHHIFQVMSAGTEGMVAAYGFELFTKLGDAGIRDILGSMYDAAPLAHSMAMFVGLADTMDLVGIHRVASHSSTEEARRNTYQSSIRFRFIECCMLIWTYMINVDPSLGSRYCQLLGTRR